MRGSTISETAVDNNITTGAVIGVHVVREDDNVIGITASNWIKNSFIFTLHTVLHVYWVGYPVFSKDLCLLLTFSKKGLFWAGQTSILHIASKKYG